MRNVFFAYMVVVQLFLQGVFAFSAHELYPPAQSNYEVVIFDDICIDALCQGAILNLEFPGFREDYLALHCLIKKYQPNTFFEIGTCSGTGTQIIKNAIGQGIVYSLELPPEILLKTEYYGLVNSIGRNCSLPYLQRLGDSMTYPYSQDYPIEGWFIDGCHDQEHVLYESKQAILSGAKLIVWHDTDIKEVFEGILEAFRDQTAYSLYRMIDTRISFALRKSAGN